MVERDLSGYETIEPSNSIIAKLITYWDMQVKQGGEVVSYEERLADISSRYGNDNVVTWANLQAKSRIEGIFNEIEQVLEGKRTIECWGSVPTAITDSAYEVGNERSE
jgi:hypothetical protein